MPLKNPVSQLLKQLQLLLLQLNETEYVAANTLLSGATIGQHYRHIIELFLVLKRGYDTEIVNYDARDRNREIETSTACALQWLGQIDEMLDWPNKSLTLVIELAESNGEPLTTSTNYYRELAYNIEHAVHHMAMIKMALLQSEDVALPVEFGVATSTLKYRAACAQ